MSNRQCGRGRRPAAGSPQAGSMFARSKVPSRPAERPKAARPPEPEMRRCPHPVQAPPPRSSGEPEAVQEPSEAVLHYIRCAMAYQNQLLADIKVLLEQLAEKDEES